MHHRLHRFPQIRPSLKRMDLNQIGCFQPIDLFHLGIFKIENVQGYKKPWEKQTEKVLTGIHQIGQELSGLNLLEGP